VCFEAIPELNRLSKPLVKGQCWWLWGGARHGAKGRVVGVLWFGLFFFFCWVCGGGYLGKVHALSRMARGDVQEERILEGVKHEGGGFWEVLRARDPIRARVSRTTRGEKQQGTVKGY